jgi:hypothetical protein
LRAELARAITQEGRESKNREKVPPKKTIVPHLRRQRTFQISGNLRKAKGGCFLIKFGIFYQWESIFYHGR